MERKQLWLALLLVLLLAMACAETNEDGNADGDADGDEDKVNDPEDFTSAGTGSNDRSYNEGELGGDGADEPSQDDGNDDPAREIVESDIFKVEGDEIYVLNRYRGLAIIDFSDPDKMSIAGRFQLAGEPKEMFVDNGVAIVLLTGIIEEDDGRYRNSSKVVSIDVSDPTSPALINEFPMAGNIVDSRQVGDVVYVVSSKQPWWDYCNQPEANQYTVEIASINIADPEDVYQADSLSFEGSGWSVYVTQTALYVASTGWDYWDYDENGTSEINYVDISDPSGKLVKRGSFNAAAVVADRFKMYQNGDVFAVTSNTSTWNGDTYFETFDVSNPDDINRRAIITIMEEEELHATNYSGNRAYIVTFRNTDPLFVVDFAYPDNPTILGDLVIPGWSTHLEIRGTKLYGVGVDNEDGWKTKVALFDVTDPTEPTQLDFLSIGSDSGYSWSEALYDWKAFKVYDALGLILIPTAGYDDNYSSYVNKLNLIDFDETSLTLRGAVASDTPIRRGFTAGDYLGSLSETRLQLIDYADRDNPEVLSSVKIATNVSSLQICGEALCNTGEGWYGSNMRLTLYDPATASDEAIYESDILEPMNGYWGGYGSLHAKGDRAYILSESYSYWGWAEDGVRGLSEEGGNRVYTFDVSDPEAPVLLGTDEISQNFAGYYYWGSSYRLIDDTSLVSAGYDYDYDDNTSTFTLDFFDLSDAADIKAGDSLSVSPLLSYGAGVVIDDEDLWSTDCESVERDDDLPISRCYAVSYNTEDLNDVKEEARINIPGELVGVGRNNTRLVTMDMQFTNSRQYDYLECKVSLEIMRHDGQHAERLNSIELYNNEYCWWLGEDSWGNDGKEPTPDDTPPSVDPDEGGGSTDGSEGSSDGETDPEPDAVDTNVMVKMANEESEFRYNFFHVEDNRLFVAYYSYDYSNGGGVVDSDMGYCYGSYDYSYAMKVEVYSLVDGELEDSFEMEDVNSYSVVDGGGLLFKGFDWYSSRGMLAAFYLSPDGEMTELDLPEQDFSSGYYGYYGASAARIGDSLYLPAGWDGIYKIDL